jgi:hypothetical protein
VLVGVALFYFVPLIFVGSPAYPSNGYRSALLGVLVASIIGIVTQELVANIRRRASELRRRERIITRVIEAVRVLEKSADPRRDGCRAVEEVSDALVVGLYEPSPVTGTLCVTTTTRSPEAIVGGAPAREGSAVEVAFRTGQQQLILEDVAAHVGNVEVWRADGAPSAALYDRRAVRGLVGRGLR